VSWFATALTVGVYGLASQMENAVTTVALIPAGALVTYVARSGANAGGVRLARNVGAVVAAVYLVVAIPLFVFTVPLTSFAFGDDVTDPTPFRICLAAGLFSCVGGIGMSSLAALGRKNAVALAWGGVVVVSVPALAVFAHWWDADGAAWAALLRDVVFLAVSATVLYSATRENNAERA
jgi:O-antigen/teichoic acid export membrane protein